MNNNFNKDLRLPFASGLPVTNLSDYLDCEQNLEHETMLGVANTKVLFANYLAIRSDFPELWNIITSGVNDEEEAIDNWLIKVTSFISTSQARSTVTNTPIALSGTQCRAWRPPRYGRAAVLGQPTTGKDELCYLFDVKGTGVPPNEDPVLPHSNGLMTLPEVVHEVMMEHLVFAAFAHANVDIRPLPSYAVIDLGFNALWLNGRKPERAVLLVRRTTTRPSFQWGWFTQGYEAASALLKTELLLRLYGLSASNCGAVRFNIHNDGDKIKADRDGKVIQLKEEVCQLIKEKLKLKDSEKVVVDGVNIQIAGKMSIDPLSLSVMDFGRYRFCDHFENDLYSWIDADYQNLNGVYLSAKDNGYVQPDLKLSLAQTLKSPGFLELYKQIENYEHNAVEPKTFADLLRKAILEASNKLRSS